MRLDNQDYEVDVTQLPDSKLVMLGIGALMVCSYALSARLVANIVTADESWSWRILARELIQRALR